MRLRGIPPEEPVYSYVGSPQGTIVGTKTQSSTIRFPKTDSKLHTTSQAGS